MITYNISLNQELAQLVNQQMKFGGFANRSEFFRQLLRNTFLTSDTRDWIDSEPYHSELKRRVNKIKKGQEKLMTSKEFDQKFNF